MGSDIAADRDRHGTGIAVRLELLLLGSFYLAAGVLQFLRSITIFEDPTGVIPDDPVGSWVLLVISVVLLGGSVRRGRKQW